MLYETAVGHRPTQCVADCGQLDLTEVCAKLWAPTAPRSLDRVFVPLVMGIRWRGSRVVLREL
jgi:hypothetical protein